MSSVWAVVPIKCFADAKSRLRGEISDRGRAALARRLSAHVLSTVLESGCFSGVLVLTNDAEIEKWGLQLGTRVARDDEKKTLSQTIESGLVRVKEWGGDSAVVIMGDLPLLSVAVLRDFLETLGRTDCVIGPDRRKVGTNILGLHRLDVVPVHFGEPESFRGHLGRMIREDLRFEIFDSVETGFDVDLPNDYASFIGDNVVTNC